MSTTSIADHPPAERQPTDPRQPAVEWPTLALIIADYGGWLAVIAAYGRVPLWLVIPVAVVLVALHGSLQHEILHGHPTRSRAVNRLLGIVPLALWLPYARYRELHLKHHVNDRLTDPLDDPETCYWRAEDWAALDPLTRTLVRLQQTLAGRILIGSWWRIWRFLRRELRAALVDRDRRRTWLEHLAWCVPVVAWVTLVGRMPLTLYVVAVVVPAHGILVIRSFAEHRADPDVRRRTAIVEGSWLLGPLFLFNNLHALHHAEPLMPWYQYNARYRTVRARLIEENGGLVYRTYFDLARRFLFRPHDVPLHPTGRAPRGEAA